MLVTLNKLWHVPYELRITTLETIFTKTLFGVTRSWSHAFLVTDIRMLTKKLLAVRPKTLRRKRRKKKKRGSSKTFCVTCKRKNKSKEFYCRCYVVKLCIYFSFFAFSSFSLSFLYLLSCEEFSLFFRWPACFCWFFFHF